MRPPARSRTVSDFSTSLSCALVKSMCTSWLPRTRPRCSKYPTPFLYRTTRRIGSLPVAADSAPPRDSAAASADRDFSWGLVGDCDRFSCAEAKLPASRHTDSRAGTFLIERPPKARYSLANRDASYNTHVV